MNFKTEQFKHHFIPSPSGKGDHLLLLVHGRTGNLRLLEWYSKRFKIPDLSYLSLQAPFEDKRPDQEDEGWSWYLDGLQGLDESRARLQTLIQELIDRGVKPTHIYWLGFSQGAAMGLDLGLRGPHLLGGLICVSGFCLQWRNYPADFGPFAKSQRYLITHGDRDEIVKLDKAKEGYDHLAKLGVPIEFKTYDKPHSFQLNLEVPYIEETLKKWMSHPP